MGFFSFLAPVGRFLKKALGLAKQYVTDENIQMAVSLAMQAIAKFDTNEERREWVVKALVRNGIPENIARIALELAVLMIKKNSTPQS